VEVVVMPQCVVRVVADSAVPFDEVADAFFGCGLDGDVSSAFGQMQIALYIDGDNPNEIKRVLSDLEARVPVTLLRIDDDLVDAPEIARRLGVTRQAVSLWTLGDRGSGDFPRVDCVIGRHRVWRWADVVAWARRVGFVDDSECDGLTYEQSARLAGWLVRRRAGAGSVA
jgi:hypothetical protein